MLQTEIKANHALDLDTKVVLQGGDLTVGRSQDCTPIVEHTHMLRREGATGSSDMKHAAKIPFVVVEDYCNRNGISFSEWSSNKEHIKRMLNDPSLAYFRIWKGQV